MFKVEHVFKVVTVYECKTLKTCKCRYSAGSKDAKD